MVDIDKVRTLKDGLNLAGSHLGYLRPPNFKFVFHLSAAELWQAAIDANIILPSGANSFVVDYLYMLLEFTTADEEFNKKPQAILGD